jgi:homocysteine S-methyltransferase
VTQARRDFEKAGIILKMRKMVKKPLAISKK